MRFSKKVASLTGDVEFLPDHAEESVHVLVIPQGTNRLTEYIARSAPLDQFRQSSMGPNAAWQVHCVRRGGKWR
jgi:hypothetical protein